MDGDGEEEVTVREGGREEGKHGRDSKRKKKSLQKRSGCEKRWQQQFSHTHTHTKRIKIKQTLSEH